MCIVCLEISFILAMHLRTIVFPFPEKWLWSTWNDIPSVEIIILSLNTITGYFSNCQDSTCNHPPHPQHHHHHHHLIIYKVNTYLIIINVPIDVRYRIWKIRCAITSDVIADIINIFDSGYRRIFFWNSWKEKKKKKISDDVKKQFCFICLAYLKRSC